MRHLPMEQWAVLIRDHHPGFIDWATFEANQARLDSNTKPPLSKTGFGSLKERECPPIIDVGEQFLAGSLAKRCHRRATQSYKSRAYSINCSSTFPEPSSPHS